MSKKQKQAMNRKEALAVLHKVNNAIGWHLYSSSASEEEKALRAQVYTAFRVLDKAVHPALASSYSSALCEFCYLRTSMQDTLVYVKGNTYSSYCCEVCLEQLKTEKKIAYTGEWDGNEYVKKEVKA